MSLACNVADEMEDDNSAPAWQDRVYTELRELTARLEKLVAFIGTGSFRALPEAHRMTLMRQLAAMLDYQSMLNTRLLLNEQPETTPLPITAWPRSNEVSVED